MFASDLSASYLLWYRATLMATFAVVCSDVRRALVWKQAQEAGNIASAVKTTSEMEEKAEASKHRPSFASPAHVSPRDRKSVSFSLPLSDADAFGPQTAPVKTEEQSAAGDSRRPTAQFPPLSSIALLPIKAEIKPAAQAGEHKEAAAQEQ